MKQIGTYINGYAFKPEDWTDYGKPIIRIQDLTGSMGSPNFYNGEIDSKYLVSKGDILVSWAATLDAFIWEKEEGWLNQHIFKALPSCDVNYQFFYWLIKLAMENMNNDNKHGIVMQHVTTKVFGNFAVSIPSVNEQQKIADYLDKVCSEVDEMVALQETMIEELKAYKQSVITEAVTKGLNPNVPMRDSGIDWIGEIPEGWKICRIKDLVETKSGSNLTTEQIANDGLYPVYGGNGIRGYYSEYSNEGEFILIGRQGALCGNINYASGKFWATEHAVVCYPKREFKLRWLGELFRTMNLGQYSLSAAQPGLAVERIKVLKMPLPPIEEQQSIASYLDEKCKEIDSLIALKEQKIEELKEYKKSVIYEYVTGKKEVI